MFEFSLSYGKADKYAQNVQTEFILNGLTYFRKLNLSFYKHTIIGNYFILPEDIFYLTNAGSSGEVVVDTLNYEPIHSKQK